MLGLGYDHLIFNKALKLKVEMKYFPYDAPIFKGFSSSKTCSLEIEQNHSNLLDDIEDYCKVSPLTVQKYAANFLQSDSNQNAELRCEGKAFSVCKFLTSARSLVSRSQ
eukprot:Lankesteria_metandrocarpae@DN5329_c0_g2_i2.p2